MRDRNARHMPITRSPLHQQLFQSSLQDARRHGMHQFTTAASNEHAYHYDSHNESKQLTPPSVRGSLFGSLGQQRSPEMEPKSRSATDGQANANDDFEDGYTRPPPFLAKDTEVVAQAKSPSSRTLDAATEQSSAMRGASASPMATESVGTPDTKRSRYLRESDRRNIIRRIDGGEKQAALAKEFGVTRAAICHIKKNRVEILMRLARPDVHSSARHPKRSNHSMAKSITPSQFSTVVDERSDDGQTFVHEVRSHALAMHLTVLRCKQTDSRQYRATADRAFRVLLEEALACVPTRAVEIVTPNDVACQGVVADQQTCAIFMSECGYPLLEVFRCIQPDSPSGFMTLECEDVGELSDSGDTLPQVTLRKMSAPPNLSDRNIFLLDATCARGHEAVVAIQSLLDFGARESSIYFVALVFSALAISEICQRFPHVHIATAAIDPEVTKNHTICPGIGNFQERYFNTTTIRQNDFGSNVYL